MRKANPHPLARLRRQVHRRQRPPRGRTGCGRKRQCLPRAPLVLCPNGDLDLAVIAGSVGVPLLESQLQTLPIRDRGQVEHRADQSAGCACRVVPAQHRAGHRAACIGTARSRRRSADLPHARTGRPAIPAALEPLRPSHVGNPLPQIHLVDVPTRTLRGKIRLMHKTDSHSLACLRRQVHRRQRPPR